VELAELPRPERVALAFCKETADLLQAQLVGLEALDRHLQ
jgi:hypothetical protein